MEEGTGQKGGKRVVPSPAVLVTAFWQKGAILYVQFVCNVPALSRSRRVAVIVRGERGKSARSNRDVFFFMCKCMCVCICVSGVYVECVKNPESRRDLVVDVDRGNRRALSL